MVFIHCLLKPGSWCIWFLKHIVRFFMVILSEAAGVFSSELIEIIYSGYQIDLLEQATRLYSSEASKEFIEHIRWPIQPQVIL